MPLASGKPALIAALMQLSTNTDPDKTPEESIQNFVDALEVFIKSADVSPTTLTPLTAPPGGGPITGLGTLI